MARYKRSLGFGGNKSTEGYLHREHRSKRGRSPKTIYGMPAYKARGSKEQVQWKHRNYSQYRAHDELA